MIELTTSLLMIASAFSTIPATDISDGIEASSDAIQDAATAIVEPFKPVTIKETEEYVRAYFKEDPILAEIARCESSFRHFDKNGNPLRGKVNSGDIGVMQINKYYHEEDASALGFDIYTLDGNLDFAKHLYERYGDKPWSSSAKCWRNPRIEHIVVARA